MVIALTEAGLSVAERVPFEVWFRGRLIGDFVADIIVNACLLLELKAAAALNSWDEAQTLNYLRASPLEIALLMNFGPRPECRRRIFTNDRKKPVIHTPRLVYTARSTKADTGLIDFCDPCDPWGS